jgi:octopine/nopaline transport system substrate-binding protein
MRLLTAALVIQLTSGVILMASGDEGWAEDPSLKIGTDGLYPPWNARTDNGEFEGFEIDLAEDLCKRIALTCTFVGQRWDGILPALTTGKYDLVMAGIEITGDREKLVDFSICYAAEVAVFATRSDNALAGTIAPTAKTNLTGFRPEAQTAISALRQALAGTIVGVQIATDHADFVKRYLLDLVEIRYFDTLENLSRDLVAGQIDAALTSRSYWERTLANEQSLDLVLFGPDMMGDVFGRGIGAAFRKRDRELRAKVNKAIEAARADGTITKLSKRWFGYDLSC